MKLPFLKTKKRLPEEIFKEEIVSATDIIAPSFIEIGQNYFKLGEKFAKTYFIFSYPRYLSAAWLSPVININFPMDISFYLHPIESEKVLKQLRKKVTEVQAELMEKQGKGLVRDPALETAYKDLEELRERLQTAQERMIRFGLYITVYGESEKELREIETVLRSVLESRLIYIKPATYRQKEGFISCSPYNLDQLFVNPMMNTGTLASTFPFVSFDLSSNTGILYGVNKHNMSLVLFDRFSMENANSIVFGGSGSGKSILGNESVLIKNNDKIQLTKIGSLVEKLIKKHGATQIDEELEGVLNPEIKVYSFDKNLRGNWSKVTVAARKIAPNIFYKFTTRGGREITTTGDHNMLLLRNGRVIAAKSSEIKAGEFIPLPRNVSGPRGALSSFNLLKLLKNSKNIYVKGAKALILGNRQNLKKANLNAHLDRYLYKYRRDRVIPIKYFWQILNHLSIKSNSAELKKIEIVSKNGKKKYSLANIFPITPEFLKIAGYICAEGTVKNRSVMISNIDKEALQDIDSSLKKIRVPFYYGNRGIIIASRVFIEIVKKLGGEGFSPQKRVLPFIFNLEKEKIAYYLSAYFEGDGGVESESSITATSKSRRLISEIAYLLYYFGIVARISKTKKEATNSNWKRKRIYWKLSITGQDNLSKFAENINFISEKKRGRLSGIINKKGNTNVDIIPGLGPIFKEIRGLYPPLLYRLPETKDWITEIGNPSPPHLIRVVDEIGARIQKFKDLTATFKTLSELPELAIIINIGKNNKDLNKVLWQNLGQSWRVVKNEGVEPFSRNAFKMIEIVDGKIYSLPEIKKALYAGFQKMDLPVKYYNRSLQTALVDKPESNTSYETIQKSAQFVWQNYQDVLINKIPLIEEKLEQLKILANSDLFWDPVVKIEQMKNKKEEYVYDLTVDNEVFLAGQGGMFVHNSYAIKLEILRYLMLGVDVIILDPENEYRFLADAVGGSFFNISLSSQNHINPFDLPLPREDERPEDVLRTNIINLVGLLRLMLGGLSPEEDSIVDRALVETYAAKDIAPETDPKSWHERIPLMSDLEEVLSSMEGTDSLVKRLQKFTRGVYSQFFNQPSNVNVENRLVVFGIRDMEDELRPMAMFIILRYIWKTITSQMKKRLLVVDEAWWIMKTEDGASFLFGTVKRARKYWLGITTVTQDVNDFMRSNYGQPIITNSAVKLLMKQSPATIGVVQTTFNLTEEEKLLLLETQVGEGLFFAGLKHVAIRVVASYTEDQIITTAPEEVAKIKKAKQELTGE